MAADAKEIFKLLPVLKLRLKNSRRLAGWPVVGLLAGWMAGWLAGWLAGLLAAWLAGWLAGLLAGWLAGWPCWLVSLAGWLSLASLT
jgi:fructose-specific phosphotransferase system IIC component